MISPQERLEQLRETVEDTHTEAAKQWRRKIYNNIVSYIEASQGDDDKFYLELLPSDYLAWVAWHCDIKKMPIFLTKKQFQMYLSFVKNSRCMWMYQRRAGKCKPGDSLVQMANGSRKRLAEVIVGDSVISLNEETGKMEHDTVSRKWETGTKECFELHLDANFRTQATAEHKFLTDEGWKRLKDITKDDYIAVPSSIAYVTDTNNLTIEEAQLISVWIAEGRKKGETFSYTNGNPDIINAVDKAARSKGWKHNSLKGEYDYSITRGENRYTPKKWIEDIGLKGCTTFGAYVPDIIFNSDNKAVAAFLSTYAGCDGYVDVNRNLIGFCSRSRRLCEDIRALLLRFGIPSSIREHNIIYNGVSKPTYETQVYGAEYLQLFAVKIGILGKMEKVYQLLEKISKNNHQQSRFTKIPTRTWSRKISYAGMGQQTVNSKALTGARAYKTTDNVKAAKLLEYSQNEELQNLLMEDVRWLKVVDIKAVGKKETYDIEVSKNHNFIADNVVTHNSVGTACILLYHAMVRTQASQILIFAPTEGQLVLMESIREILASEAASWLWNKYLGEGVTKGGASEATEDSKSRIGVKFNEKFIRLANDATIKAVTLNTQRGGATKRGESADILVVDEFQDVDKDIKSQVIEPIVLSSFSKKKESKLIYIGTPHTNVDFKLDKKWEEAKEPDSGTGTLHSTCWEAMEEGVRTPNVMKGRFRDEEIPCRWVLKHGICPVFLPKMYERTTGDPVDRDENGNGVVGCGEICMNNNAFVQEDMAMFPQNDGLGIPPEHVQATSRDYRFITLDEAPSYAGKHLVLSVDLGDIHADTQICVWELVSRNIDGYVAKTLRLIYQEAVNDNKKVGVKNPAVARIKEIYQIFQPKDVCLDATGKKEFATELITGSDPIDRTRFITNESSKKNGVVGYTFTGPSKAELFDNMKRAFRLNKLEVPSKSYDMVFWDKYFNGIVSLKPEPPVPSRPYVKWGITGHMADAIALACLTIKEEGRTKAWLGVGIGEDLSNIDFYD